MNHRFGEALATQSALVKAINYIAATLGIPEPWRLGPNGLAAVLRWQASKGPE